MPASGNAFRPGWTVGGGVEAEFAPRWSVKLEYLFVNLGSAQLFYVAPNVPETVSFNANIIRLGVNYNFAPVASDAGRYKILTGGFSPARFPAPERLGHAEPALFLDEARDLFDALAFAQIGEDEGPAAAHPLRLAFHRLQRSPDMRRQIDLVDHQQIDRVMPGPPFEGILSPAATSMT